MRLNPKPPITGFEILGPVVTALTPGILAIASIMLVERFVVRYCLLTVAMDMGDRFISMAFDDPVTTTSANSVALSSNSKLAMVTPWTDITLEKALNPNALIWT